MIWGTVQQRNGKMLNNNDAEVNLCKLGIIKPVHLLKMESNTLGTHKSESGIKPDTSWLSASYQACW